MPRIELKQADKTDHQPIVNLMQFYNYDFSEWIPLSFTDDGFFCYPTEARRPTDTRHSRGSSDQFLSSLTPGAAQYTEALVAESPVMAVHLQPEVAP